MTIQQVDASQVPYQILNAEGKLVGTLPDLSDERLLELYRSMQLGRTFSNKVVALQRQGRATTFGSLVGQEATAVGMLYSFRGMTPADWPAESRCLPYQIVIGTQMLHAVGLGMAAKIAGEPTVSVGVCGDGATSEGDFNEALNFAGVFQVPVVLIVQNNGWAISVPRKKQSAAPSFAARGAGFGVPARLVDGNDILAVYDAVNQAVEHARSGQGPTLIETLTYRIGAHTTADDPTRYRDAAEVAAWQARDPIARFQTFLLERDLLSQSKIEQMLAEIEEQINRAVEAAESTPNMAPDCFFDYATAELTPRLQEQRADLLRHSEEKRR